MHLISHRPSPAGEPVDHHDLALRTIVRAACLPPRDETIVLFLDDAQCAVVVVTVTGTARPDAVIDVVECLTAPAAHGGRVSSVIVGTVRTRRTAADEAERDVDRWLEISDIAEGHGVEVLEWYVIDPDGPSCPRDRLGEPPRW